MKNHLVKNGNFSLDNLWRPKVKSDRNTLPRHDESSQRFFRILPSYHTTGDISDCLRKKRNFSKFDLW